MTETEAKDLVRQRLSQDIDADYPKLWVGNTFAETPDTFIIEGAVYSDKENRDDGYVLCAVHKASGKCGLVLPPPGPALARESFESFSWDGSWVIV